jgi:transcriptional regulator with XRE-family HTH domain
MEIKKKKRLIDLPPEVRGQFVQVRDPDDRNNYIKALREEGWTLESIAKATGMTRERVRQIAKATTPMPLNNKFVVPSLPVVEPKAKRVEVSPSPETLQRLKELQPLAQQVRSNAARFREEAEEYTKLLWEAHKEQGVSLYRMAKLLGVTHSALRFRLIRYGYLEGGINPSNRVYAPIKSENRAK